MLHSSIFVISYISFFWQMAAMGRIEDQLRQVQYIPLYVPPDSVWQWHYTFHSYSLKITHTTMALRHCPAHVLPIWHYKVAYQPSSSILRTTQYFLLAISPNPSHNGTLIQLKNFILFIAPPFISSNLC